MFPALELVGKVPAQLKCSAVVLKSSLVGTGMNSSTKAVQMALETSRTIPETGNAHAIAEGNHLERMTCGEVSRNEGSKEYTLN